MQRPLRRSGAFKVTDFGTNRKLIITFANLLLYHEVYFVFFDLIFFSFTVFGL